MLRCSVELREQGSCLIILCGVVTTPFLLPIVILVGVNIEILIRVALNYTDLTPESSVFTASCINLPRRN